ncbi:MAG: hypothetical protein CBB71_17800 [Rhodopirellula sp. TMED11]|nr:MAG: hypothetical protein CBB71_17800 [Rhodopirellula sp. TMED11]
MIGTYDSERAFSAGSQPQRQLGRDSGNQDGANAVTRAPPWPTCAAVALGEPSQIGGKALRTGPQSILQRHKRSVPATQWPAKRQHNSVSPRQNAARGLKTTSNWANPTVWRNLAGTGPPPEKEIQKELP